jgi:signal peptide peptidase SppA
MMPLPRPNKGEPEKKFIGRCMANPTMKREYPDQKQRTAVCYSQWRKSKSRSEATEADDGRQPVLKERYENVLSLIFGDVWAIIPDKLAVLADVVAQHAQTGALSPEEIEARAGGIERPVRRVTGKVAVLPLFGVMANRANLITNWSGGTSTEQFGGWFDAAMEDSSVGAVILDVNSPGGSVHGLEELSSKIFNARGTKPIIAVANPLAASAAYYVATAADEIVATPGGLVGSVGTIAVHTDVSQMNEVLGIKYTYITAGRRKSEGNPNEPLAADAQEYMQYLVNKYYAAFVDAVARNRGVKTTVVKKSYGEGRVVDAEQAVELGMSDRIGTLESVLAEFGASMPREFGGVKAEDEACEPASESDEDLAEQRKAEQRRRNELRLLALRASKKELTTAVS